MKHLRYIGLLLAVVLGLNFTATAQDSRNRVASTIVADGLAQLPAQNLDALEQVMSEIAGTGAEGISMLVQYLNDSGEGKGAAFEYAIDGLTSYVSQNGRENLRAPIREGLKKGIAAAKTNARKAFFVQQLGKIASQAEVPLFEGMLNDSYLKEYAQAALTPLGKGKAIPALNIKDIAVNSSKIAAFREKVEGTATNKQASLLAKALKDKDRNIRTNALALADELGIQNFDQQAAKAYAKADADTKTDILRWLGNNHNKNYSDLVAAATKSADSQVATAAIEAAGRIGGEQSLTALVEALDGSYAKQANTALTAFNGNIKNGILDALKTKGANVSKDIVALAGERRIRLPAVDTAHWQGRRTLRRREESGTDRHRRQVQRPAGALQRLSGELLRPTGTTLQQGRHPAVGGCCQRR